MSVIGLFALLFPLRTLSINVDGNKITTRTRSVDERAIVAHAGVSLRSGDRIDTTSGALVVRRARDVGLTIDGRTYAMRAQADTIGDLLDQAGVSLAADDSVLHQGEAASLNDPISADQSSSTQEPLVIEVRRALPFTVVENGHSLDVQSSGSTIGSALRDVGVRLGAGDDVQPALDTPLSAGLQVHIDHAREMVVTLPEGKSTIYTVATTVGEALADSGLSLPADYRLDPPAETTISAGLAVHVVGISSELFLETERIQSYVVYEPDPSLPHGTQRVVEGQDGVHYRQFQVVSQDGVAVSRELAAEWDDPASVDTVVYYSTVPAPAVIAQEPPPAYSGDWRELACSYDWDCDWALAVIMCESGGNPNAYNPAGYVGLFQIWEGFGANLRDPATNVAAAYSIYASTGRGAWPNCP